MNPRLDARLGIMDASRYMTIATADAQGVPWVSPVWFARQGRDGLLWVSDPTARHSRNIAVRPEVAIVVFDSGVAPGDAQGVYLEATAEQLSGAALADGIAAFAGESERQGLAAWTLADVTAPARHRLYRATITTRWALGPHDQRIPLA
jgi:predicted pyridoxine 5'-phosphate oxidase superfamily flavin-nucleotide-binding protein